MAICKKCGQQVVIGEVYHRECIEAELEQLQKEKNELLAALREADKDCCFCKWNSELVDHDCAVECSECTDPCRCHSCADNRNWEWRGVKEGE